MSKRKYDYDFIAWMSKQKKTTKNFFWEKKYPRTSTRKQKSPKMIMAGRCACFVLDISLYCAHCFVVVVSSFFIRQKQMETKDKLMLSYKQSKWRWVWLGWLVGWLEIRILFFLFLIDFFCCFGCVRIHTIPYRARKRMLATRIEWNENRKKTTHFRCVYWIEKMHGIKFISHCLVRLSTTQMAFQCVCW